VVEEDLASIRGHVDFGFYLCFKITYIKFVNYKKKLCVLSLTLISYYVILSFISNFKIKIKKGVKINLCPRGGPSHHFSFLFSKAFLIFIFLIFLTF